MSISLPELQNYKFRYLSGKCEVRAHQSAMVHDHNWQNEPPLDFNKSYDERYGDEEDEASNSFWSSSDGVQHLQSMLEKDPAYETSPNWPQLVEWCSTCSATRFVRVALPPAPPAMSNDKKDSEVKGEVKLEPKETIQEQVVESVAVKDASTQTLRQRRRRSGGKGSRLRRLLAFQLMLSNKHGLPHSRLNLRRLDARSPGEKNNGVQDDCSESMLLKEEKVDVVVEEEKIEVEETREKESCQSVGASTGGSTHFTPRSTHADVILPSPQPLPCFLPFPNLFTPFFTPPNLPLYVSSPVGQMPGSFWVLCGACNSWGTIVA